MRAHLRQVVIDALKKNKVDLQVYFSGVMNGEHCFKFAENGEKIMNEISS